MPQVEFTLEELRGVIKAEVGAEVRAEVAPMRADIGVMKEAIGTLKSDVTFLKTELTDFQIVVVESFRELNDTADIAELRAAQGRP
jgi:hypothetical protein